MQTGDELQGDDRLEAIGRIIKMRDFCLKECDELARLGLHKAIINRYVEPWSWITVLISATRWNQFFRLRCHPMAEKHFNHVACMIRDAMSASIPEELDYGQWHLPFIKQEDFVPAFNLRNELELSGIDVLKRVSAGRCARLSYMTHEGKRDLRDDVRLCNQLIDPKNDDDVMHASPLEHPAMVAHEQHQSGPYRGWSQFRKEFIREDVDG